MSNALVGATGENLAAEYLQAQGFVILARNVVQSGVEADIIARDGETIVVVEVKTKHNHYYGLPQEMVGFKKQKQLRRFANILLAKHPTMPVRIDVVAVTLRDIPQFEHIMNAVEG